MNIARPYEDRGDPGEGSTLITYPAGWSPPFPLDVEAFFQDSLVYRRLVLLEKSEYSAGARGVMRQAAIDLRERIETELER